MICGVADAEIPYSPRARLVFPVATIGVNPADPIIVEFDVNVTGVDENTFTVNATGSQLFVVGEVFYGLGSRSAQFSRAEGLPPNTDLTVTLSNDIRDPVTSSPLLPTEFLFQTGPDTTRPGVLSSTPSAGAANQSVGTNVSVRFSEPVVGVSASTFTLVETVSSNAVTGAVSYDFDTRTATFDPVDQLSPGLNYTALLGGAAIQDVSGNFLVTFQLSFTTGADTLAPTVRVTSPLNADTNVAVNANVVVTFDEPVMNVTAGTFQLNGGAIAGAVSMTNGGRTWTFDPTANLPAATTINVTLGGAITDTSTNALAPFAFSFTTI
jgi:hypothetical protein